MFLGEYKTTFTGQGRLVLPKKFRQDNLEEKTVVLSRGFEGCIWGFTLADFEKEAAKQLEMSVTEKGARDLRRYFFSGAEKVILDEQGRFVIPRSLLDYAQLTKEVVLVGAGDHFEIWDSYRWQELIKKLTEKQEP